MREPSLLQREPHLFQHFKVPAKGRGLNSKLPAARDGKPMSWRQFNRMKDTASVTKFPPSAINMDR